MDSHYARAFPRNSFDAEAFRPTVRSHPIQPIELAIPNDPMIGNAGLYNPSLFVNPALMQNMSMPGMFPVGGAHVPQYGNPTTVHPASLHFGNVMPGQSMGVQPFVGSPVSRPNSGGIQSTSASFSSAPRAAAFSRRTEGNSLGPSRHSSVAVGGGGEPYFCRTPNSTLRQRTAQACEKCRDRKTKCSGERPICKRCSERGMTCKWAPETRVRGHSRSKASGQVPAADLPSESIEALSHPIPSLPASSSDEQLASSSSSSSDASASTGKHAESTSSNRDRAKRGSLSRAMAKKNLAAQRYSWPMGSPSSSLQVGGMLPQTSIPLPVSALDDTWDSMWNRREPPQVDAAPVPGRAFDFESLMNGSFDYSSESSHGNSPPMTASTSDSSLSTLSSSIDSLDGLSAILQSQLPAAEDSDFTAEMYDLLNLPASSSSESSSSSSGSSPASGIFDDNLADFAEAAKANGGDIANEITPMPQMTMGQDDNFMSQYLSSDFYGL